MSGVQGTLRTSKSTTHTPDIFRSTTSLRLHNSTLQTAPYPPPPPQTNHPLSTNASSVQFHSTSQGDLPKVETLQLALKIGSKGARQQTEVLYGGATVSRENSMRATDRPSIEAGPRQTMFVTGKSLSSSRVLNFSGVNNRSSASRHNAESENVSVTLLSSRNKQANSSVLVSSGLRNTSQKQLGLLTRREPFIKGNSKKSKLKAKKQLRLEPHVLRKKPHTNSYISLHKKDSSTPAGLSASSSAENFSCLQGVGARLLSLSL